LRYANVKRPGRKSSNPSVFHNLPSIPKYSEIAPRIKWAIGCRSACAF